MWDRKYIVSGISQRETAACILSAFVFLGSTKPRSAPVPHDCPVSLSDQLPITLNNVVLTWNKCKLILNVVFSSNEDVYQEPGLCSRESEGGHTTGALTFLQP